MNFPNINKNWQLVGHFFPTVLVHLSQRHVYLIHLKQPDMFTCSGCDYTNSNSIWEMRKHCVAQHGGAAEAISNEEKHKDIIQVCMHRTYNNINILTEMESEMFPRLEAKEDERLVEI